MRYLVLSAFACLLALTLVSAISYAQGVDRGAAAALAELDAGSALPSQDLGDADRATAHPKETIDTITKVRRTGGLWAAAAVVLLIAARLWIRYAKPSDDEEPDPTGWRARSLAAATALALLAATLVDIWLGPTPAIALVPVLPTVAMTLIDVVNPKRGSARQRAAATTTTV